MWVHWIALPVSKRKERILELNKRMIQENRDANKALGTSANVMLGRSSILSYASYFECVMDIYCL